MKIWTKWLFNFLFLLMFHRLVLTLKWGVESESHFSVYDFFVTSVRFDLMVAAFCLMPFWGLAVLENSFANTQSPELEQNKLRYFFFILNRLYIWAMSLAIGFICWSELIFMRRFDDRWNFLGLDAFEFKPNWLDLILGIFYFALAMNAANSISIRQFKIKKIARALRPRGWSRLSVDFILIVLFARGSFSAHHLDLRFSEISDSSKINRLTISSPYALDQALRKRR